MCGSINTHTHSYIVEHEHGLRPSWVISHPPSRRTFTRGGGWFLSVVSFCAPSSRELVKLVLSFLIFLFFCRASFFVCFFLLPCFLFLVGFFFAVPYRAVPCRTRTSTATVMFGLSQCFVRDRAWGCTPLPPSVPVS